MSNHNYMDDVPVKISESYKPLPKVFQVPQAIANKLQLPAQHYYESPHYAYDFQLEKKVLTKLPDWRRMRQHERELRLERKQRREEQRMRALEQQQKQMLGAVSYPDAEELSSESDTDEEQPLKQDAATPPTETNDTAVDVGSQKISEAISSFDNILQPTILPQAHNAPQHIRNKSSSSFNYKDFEEDTSSPFDNIELKTINDLDILAQVLQQAQLKAKEEHEKTTPNLSENAIEPHEFEIENLENKSNLESNQCALERNNVNVVNQQQQKTNIPETHANNFEYVDQHHTQASTHNLNAYAVNMQQVAYMQYNQQQPQQQQFNTNFNELQQQQQMYVSNHNYLYSPAACNGGSYYSQSRAAAQPTSQNFIGHNANTYLAAPFVSSYGSPQILHSNTSDDLHESESKNKSKSVPDILKELTDEVRNSELRRSRIYSYNMQQQEEGEISKDSTVDVATESMKTHYRRLPKTPNRRQHSPCYNMLEATTQKLAQNISSMGFPLERVSKIAQLFGADDKKIIEHLIPLSELIDLGFDESKISEALMRFDNNKEKALEYLIS